MIYIFMLVKAKFRGHFSYIQLLLYTVILVNSLADAEVVSEGTVSLFNLPDVVRIFYPCVCAYGNYILIQSMFLIPF